MANWYQTIVMSFLKVTFTRPLSRKLNTVAIFHDKEPKNPYILIANHALRQDGYLIGSFNKNTNYMGNADGISSVERIVSHLVGMYSKKKGASDISALKKTFELIDQNNIIGIFAEGDRCWDGETATLIPGSIHIAKRKKTALLIAKITGNYLTQPRWADFRRKGKIIIDFHTISVEEIQNGKLKELREKVKTMLHNNDIKNPINDETKFIGENIASGIQHILWICPNCGEKDTITGNNDEIICTACNHKWNINGNLKISPHKVAGKDLKDWIDWQKQQMEEIYKLPEGKVLTSTKNIQLGELVNRKMVNSYDCDINLYHDRIEAVDKDKEVTIFSVNLITHYIDNFNKAFEFDYEQRRFRILFNGKNAYKWIYFLNLLKRK